MQKTLYCPSCQMYRTPDKFEPDFKVTQTKRRKCLVCITRQKPPIHNPTEESCSKKAI